MSEKSKMENGSEFRRLLLVAPDYTEEEVLTRGSTSPAASAWVRGFLNVLNRFANVDASFWFDMERAWPRGRLFVEAEMLESTDRQRSVVKYLNIPWVKTKCISRSLSLEVLSSISADDDVLVYGQRTFTPKDFQNISRRARRVFLIVPDAEPGAKGMREIEAVASHASGGVICLPAELAKSLGQFRTISFQGVVNSRHTNKLPASPKKHKLVFIGGVDRISGAHFLRAALEIADLNDCRIIVMGRIGDEIEAAKLRELGVDVTGFVEASRIETECNDAFAFLNPRDPNLTLSARNFPSKLLLYMKFNRPIVSTDTAGIPRALADALDCSEVRTPYDFAQKLEQLITSSEAQYKERTQKLQKFVEVEYTEEAVTEKLRNYFA